MVALVAFALIFLAWSYLKSQGNNVRSGQSEESNDGSSEKNESLENIMSSCSDDKQLQKVVVIMAGENTPRFIANPTS